MSAESSLPPTPPAKPTTGGTPHVRRISKPRPKKTVTTEQPPDDGTTAATTATATTRTKLPPPAKFPEFSTPSESQAPRHDWPEPEPATAGTASPSENPKRKRRRKKNKGSHPQNAAAPDESKSTLPTTGDLTESTAAPTLQQAQPPPQGRPPRLKIDPDLLAQRAWKIYLSEISEEGVALVGDSDAKELARRCFRLAEIFIEEQARGR